MPWANYTHADINRSNPRPLGVCDRCGFTYNRDMLRWQYQWAGKAEFNLRILVCPPCMDTPQEQLRTIILPIDPVPIANPRPGEYAGMVISSSPDIYDTIVPNQLVVESSGNPDLGNTNIGNREPIVTETSSLPLMPEITITPNPDPNYGGEEGDFGTDGGYSRGAST